jgi:UDP-glucose 4-epimerase
VNKILLIGGAGFIGRALAGELLRRGFAVRVADILPLSDCGFPPDKVEYVQANYNEQEALEGLLGGVDAVVHLAHQAMLLGLDSSMTVEIERNVLPAVRLMDACLDAKIGRLVFLSSGGTVYGEAESASPLPERYPLQPISVYGVSKSLTEQVARLYSVQRGLPVTIVRPSNAYGPGQVPFRGQGLVATVMASAMTGKPITVYGDGTAVRDYIHVADIAEGIASILQRGAPGQTYNLGSGHGTTVNELIRNFIQPFAQRDGLSLDVRYVPARGVDVAYNVLDCEALKRDCGFAPKVDLSQGLDDTWQWMKQYLATAGQ